MYAWLSRNGANSVPLFFLFFFFSHEGTGARSCGEIDSTLHALPLLLVPLKNAIRIIKYGSFLTSFFDLRIVYLIGCISDYLSLN